MSNVKSYRFKKKVPNLKLHLEDNKDEWSEFIKYMNNLKNISNYPLPNSECVVNSYGEDCMNINENEISENIDDIIKLKKWNEMQIDNHYIHKKSFSDVESNSNSSGSAFIFNKYNILQNNIYSNNANCKRQKIKNYTDGYKGNEKYEIEESKKNSNVNAYKKKGKQKYNNLREKREFKNDINKVLNNNERGLNEFILNKSLLKKNQRNFNKKKKDKDPIFNDRENEYEYVCDKNDSFTHIKNKNCLESGDYQNNDEIYKSKKLQKKTYIKNNLKNYSSFLKNIDRGKHLSNNELYSTPTYNKFSNGHNKDKSDYKEDGMNLNIIKKNKSYETEHSSRIYKNKENKLRKNNNIKKKKKKKVENNLEIDGSYAYNYAYLSNNDESSFSSPTETSNDTIMNLDEEINNYQFNNLI